ncbi:hypothetical protein ALNOE001_01300 [Candidatus Methanobinarius endosymbioticus]|uniref:Uncharacterized protein n=1 Tax=Candidatus Methanobinarius endosymbioticus TaxID=2006182 RepID=A0A366MF91_9EURY|nr:hypothetical protein ALNOE001_01300 [Candidatus Methanobinarius endosymbioticus]
MGNILANVKLSIVVGKTYSVITDGRGEWSLLYTPTCTGKIQISLQVILSIMVSLTLLALM